MAINVASNFSYNGKLPLDARDQFKTFAEMKAFPETDVDEGHITMCLEDGKNYQFKASNAVDAKTGKWREFSSGGGGGSLPSGGTTGQALVKKSNADQDVDWDDILAGVDYVFHEDTEEIEVFGGEAPSVNPSDLISKDQGNKLKPGSDNKLFTEGGGGGGTTDYTDLENKPSINGVELIGDKTNADLDIFSKVDYSYDEQECELELFGSPNRKMVGWFGDKGFNGAVSDHKDIVNGQSLLTSAFCPIQQGDFTITDNYIALPANKRFLITASSLALGNLISGSQILISQVYNVDTNETYAFSRATTNTSYNDVEGTGLVITGNAPVKIGWRISYTSPATEKIMNAKSLIIQEV